MKMTAKLREWLMRDKKLNMWMTLLNLREHPVLELLRQMSQAKEAPTHPLQTWQDLKRGMAW
jgi:hypothetical protein